MGDADPVEEGGDIGICSGDDPELGGDGLAVGVSGCDIQGSWGGDGGGGKCAKTRSDVSGKDGGIGLEDIVDGEGGVGVDIFAVEINRSG